MLPLLSALGSASCRCLRNQQPLTLGSLVVVPIQRMHLHQLLHRLTLLSRSGQASARVAFSSSTDQKRGKDAAAGEAGQQQQQRRAKASKEGEEGELEEVTEVILKEIPEAKIHWEYQQPSASARVYDLKPIKIKCKEGRTYMWCACGLSRNQPFCDGTHRFTQLGATLKPLPWTCKQTGYYWFCNCKRSAKRVFCDGTHVELKSDPNLVTTVKH